MKLSTVIRAETRAGWCIRLAVYAAVVAVASVVVQLLLAGSQ